MQKMSSRIFIRKLTRFDELQNRATSIEHKQRQMEDKKSINYGTRRFGSSIHFHIIGRCSHFFFVRIICKTISRRHYFYISHVYCFISRCKKTLNRKTLSNTVTQVRFLHSVTISYLSVFRELDEVHEIKIFKRPFIIFLDSIIEHPDKTMSSDVEVNILSTSSFFSIYSCFQCRSYRNYANDTCNFIRTTDDCNLSDGFLNYLIFVFCTLGEKLLGLGLTILVNNFRNIFEQLFILSFL